MNVVLCFRNMMKYDKALEFALKVKEENVSRLTQSIETALKLSKGLVKANIDGENHLYNNSYACSDCGFSFEEPEEITEDTGYDEHIFENIMNPYTQY